MYTFEKIERLCSKSAIDRLFQSGQSKTVFPLKMVYLDSDFESPYPARVMFVVSKRKFKRANKRNLLKRRLREAYRLNKENLYQELNSCKKDMAFLYLSHEELSYHEIEKRMKQLLTHLSQQKSTNGRS